MEPLIAAVQSGDVGRLHALLSAGADPDTVDEHGTPALCLAVDAFDLPIVEVLTASADLDRSGSTGRAPLLRAIELGAQDIVARLVDDGADLWATDSDGLDALALARYWHTMDAAAEVLRRSGRFGPVERRVVLSGWGTSCQELALGDVRVRTGHAAILTALEPRYGVSASFDELLSRALAEPDVDHEVWSATTYGLQQRHDPAVWAAAAGLRDSPNPLERLFGAEVIRLTNLFDESDGRPFDRPLVDLFLPWVAGEPDARVVRSLTNGLADTADPRTERPLLELTHHPDRTVRQRAVAGLHHAIETGKPEILDAVMERTRDEDAAVRRTACIFLAAAPRHIKGPSASLASCLTDPDEGVRVEAAARLALRDDPRGDDVLLSLDAADEDSPYHWLLEEVSCHRYRQGR
ncbi:hypothetical protein KPP03845_100088 [Streptomyces xanthophaeus]|nr:hypothetical protein KPP03845_100088 [Streptomyces xanthophaeus]